MIGLTLYHAVNLNEHSDILGDVLAATRARSGRALSYVQGQLTSSDRFSRQQKVTPSVLAQLQTDLRGGVFRSLVFDELSKSQQKLNDGYASLQIDLKPAKSPQANSNEIALYPYRAVMLVPRTSVERPEQLQESTLHLAAALNAPYGFVHLGGDYRDVLMEVTSTPMFSWGHKMSATDLQRQARLLHCQAERVRLGTVTCGTYWGNLLGKQIVDRLGGVE